MQRRHFDTLVSIGGLVLAVVLIVFGFYFKDRYDYAQNTVKTQLSAQKIYFADKADMSKEELANPRVAANAGKQVTTGDQAEIFANDYIGLHVKEIASGQTYSEVSEKVQAAYATGQQPDPKLVSTRDTLFRGEMLRGVLLTTYGFWQLGEQAQFAMWICFIAGGVLLLLSILGFVHAFRTPKEATI